MTSMLKTDLTEFLQEELEEVVKKTKKAKTRKLYKTSFLPCAQRIALRDGGGKIKSSK